MSKVLQPVQRMYNAVIPNLVSMQNFGFNAQPRSRWSAWTSASLMRSSSKLTWHEQESWYRYRNLNGQRHRIKRKPNGKLHVQAQILWFRENERYENCCTSSPFFSWSSQREQLIKLWFSCSSPRLHIGHQITSCNQQFLKIWTNPLCFSEHSPRGGYHTCFSFSCIFS